MALWKFRERKKKKWPRRLLFAGIALALFTVGGFFVAPSIIRTQVEKRAGEALGRTVTVGRVRVNPYTASITLEQLDVRLKDGSGSFLGWDRLHVNLDPLASIIGSWSIGEIELDGFHVAAQLKADGSFNFSDILARLNAPAAGPAAPAKPGRPVHIGSLRVDRARMDFADLSRAQPFTTTLGPLSFGLTDFRTAGAGARGAPYQFEAVTEAGERLSWTGTLSADPVSSAGELRLENILLAKYAPYYSSLMQADLSEGKLFLRGRYELNLAESSRVMKLSDGALQLRNVKLTDRTTREALVELTALDIAGVHADALTHLAAIESVTFTGGAVRARREKDGTLNLLAMLAPAPAAAPTQTAPAAAPVKTPEFMIGELALRDCSVELTDLAAPRPAQLSLAGIQFSLKKVTLAEGAVMPLSLALNWAPQGTIKVDGSVTLKPELKADLETEASALAILPLSPYLEQFINARITQGSVSSNGAVQLTMVAGAPAVTFDGGVTVERFGLVDGALNEELAGFGSLALHGLKAATAPQLTVSLAEVAVTAPYARVLVNQDGTLNLAGLAKTETVGGALRPDLSEPSGRKAPPTVKPTATPLPKIEIGKVVIADGDFTLTDRSLEPNVRMAVNRFGGTIAGLSSENLAKADVDLKAAVDGAGPVTITGRLDPLGAKKFVDLKIGFRNVDLLPLSPYSGKYAGYELARGQLNVDVQAKLDGRQLDATNVITLNQFTFGAPVESPAATKLPVRLGVALLKDLNGQIVIDVPMSGSIDDPNLRLGKVVLRVVVNLLTKAAVSPFALLGSMFGGGGDELAFQEFAPGGSDLSAAGIKKLETMVKALTNRPGLSISLEGGYDGPADSSALRQQKLVALVRGRIWEERHAANPNIPPPEQTEFTLEEQLAMARRLFDEKFPAGTQSGSPPDQAPATVAAPASGNKSLLRRVVDVITFGIFSAEPAQPAEPVKVAPVAAPGAAPAGLSPDEMIGRLVETMAVDDNDLRALAAARAQRVRDYFLTEGKIAADRLFLVQDKGGTKENKGPRVFLSLQ